MRILISGNVSNHLIFRYKPNGSLTDLKDAHWSKCGSYITFVIQPSHFCTQMTDMEGKKTVEHFIDRTEEHWKPILRQLRQVILSTELEESVKWGMPVYTLNGKNVVGLGAHKSYAGALVLQWCFFKR
ncbi:MAG: DUF1801 domain-containing protein [Saprospiraceae bacterium]